ncbi:MAG: hypothetical protein EAZ47_07945 [Bacteroidetes bacterium]|nr:MAG: hypothetical protein EAZ47_07945 [Bacteroidota bacterium]
MVNIFQNPNTTAILAGIAVIFSYFLAKRVSNQYLLAGLIFLGLVAFFGCIYLESRSVLLAVCSVIILDKLLQPADKVSRKSKIKLLILLLLLGVTSTFYKHNSTLGRAFIYKVDFLIAKENWLTGINAPYNIVFNHTQANYFKENPNAPLHEKLLAGNNYYVLNEWVNVLLQFGVFAFLLSLVLTIYIVRLSVQEISVNSEKSWAAGIILFFLVISLFLYPFRYIPYHFVFSCCVIYNLRNVTILGIKTTTIFWKIGILLLTVHSGISIFRHQKNELDNHEVSELIRIGHINSALTKCLSMHTNDSTNFIVTQRLADLYEQKNKLDSALFYISSAHNHVCNDNLHNFWGRCLQGMGRKEDAIVQYELAVNIKPHKFKNRVDLLSLLLQSGRIQQAEACAEEIINIPEKIPSAKSAFYKQYAKKTIDSLNTPRKTF